MATPEELLQQEITQRTEEAKLLQKKLTLLEEEKIGKEEHIKLQEELNSKNEELLKTIQEAKESNVELDTSVAEEFLSRLEGIGNAINGNGTAEKEETEEVGWLKKIWGAITTPVKNPFEKEEKDEQKNRDDKARGLLERIAEGVEEIGEGFGEEVEVGGLGFGGILLLIAGAVTGFVIQLVAEIGIFALRIGNFIRKLGVGAFEKLKDGFLVLKNFFGKIGDFIKSKIPEKWITKFDEGVDAFRATLGKIGTKFRNFFKIGDKVDDTVDSTRRGLRIFDKIGDIFKSISKFGGKTVNFAGDVIKSGGKIFSNVVDMIGGLVKPFTKIFKGGMKFGKSFGKILGPLGIVISIIDGIVQSIMGFISGFKEGGLVGGLKGAIEGLFNSIVGDLVNMGADLLGWIVKKLGFEDVGQAIMDFDFLGKLKEWYAVISEKLTGALDEIKIAFMNVEFMVNDIKSFFTETIPNAFDSIVTKLKNVWTTTKEKIALFNPFAMIRDGIINLMPNIFGLKEKIASLLGTSVQSVGERASERRNNITGFGEMVRTEIGTRLLERIPEGLGLRKRAAKMMGLPMISDKEIEERKSARILAEKEESEREQFIKIRQQVLSTQMKAEGASKEQIEGRQAEFRQTALRDYESINKDALRLQNKDIISLAQESLRATQKDLIEAEKERKNREKEESKSVAPIISTPTTQVVSNSSVTSNTQLGIKTPATDMNFLKTIAEF